MNDDAIPTLTREVEPDSCDTTEFPAMNAETVQGPDDRHTGELDESETPQVSRPIHRCDINCPVLFTPEYGADSTSWDIPDLAAKDE